MSSARVPAMRTDACCVVVGSPTEQSTASWSGKIINQVQRSGCRREIPLPSTYKKGAETDSASYATQAIKPYQIFSRYRLPSMLKKKSNVDRYSRYKSDRTYAYNVPPPLLSALELKKNEQELICPNSSSESVSGPSRTRIRSGYVVQLCEHARARKIPWICGFLRAVASTASSGRWTQDVLKGERV